MSSSRIPYSKSQQALSERDSRRGYDSRGSWVPDEARLAPGDANRRAYDEGAPHYYTTSGTTSDAEQYQIDCYSITQEDEEMSKQVLFYGKEHQLWEAITYSEIKFLTDDAFDEDKRKQAAYFASLFRGTALRWLADERQRDPIILNNYENLKATAISAFAKSDKARRQESKIQ
ncbi:hypothetical protein VTN96DRAFT_8382 [Rasamsonia emersonii]